MSLLPMVLCSCGVWVNAPTQPESSPTPYASPTPTPSPSSRVSLAADMLFPFEDNTNWWRYTESGGNRVSIEVTDTISDENVLYYRVSFKENRVDTTDDWFKRVSHQIMFAPSLIGSYSLFLPARIDSAKGSFISATGSVNYTYYDTLSAGGTLFRHVLVLDYATPILHGFNEIAFADSVGIVRLTDSHGRWPVEYAIDSCSVFGEVAHYR